MGVTKTLFSKVHGVVLNHGKPVPNAVITRFYNVRWTDEEKTENIAAAADGSFKFAKVSRFSLATTLFPHEPAVSQTIKIHRDGKEYIACEQPDGQQHEISRTWHRRRAAADQRLPTLVARFVVQRVGHHGLPGAQAGQQVSPELLDKRLWHL